MVAALQKRCPNEGTPEDEEYALMLKSERHASVLKSERSVSMQKSRNA